MYHRACTRSSRIDCLSCSKLDELAEQLQQLRDAKVLQTPVSSTQSVIAPADKFGHTTAPFPLSPPAQQYHHTTQIQSHPSLISYYREREQAGVPRDTTSNFMPVLGPSQSLHQDDLENSSAHNAAHVSTSRRLHGLKLDGEQIEKIFQMYRSISLRGA